MKKTERNEYDELLPLLPLSITTIQVQKRIKNDFHYFMRIAFIGGIKPNPQMSNAH